MSDHNLLYTVTTVPGMLARISQHNSVCTQSKLYLLYIKAYCSVKGLSLCIQTRRTKYNHSKTPLSMRYIVAGNPHTWLALKELKHRSLYTPNLIHFDTTLDCPNNMISILGSFVGQTSVM